TITIDGLLDILNQEWRSTELLDDDERLTLTNQRDPQALYATWSATALLLGFKGGWWTLDGALWAYVDSEPGGATALVQDLPGRPLPAGFLANYAIQVDSPTTATVYRFTGGSWQPQMIPGFAFAQGRSGGTEIRLPWTLGSVSGTTWFLKNSNGNGNADLFF